MPQKKIKFLTIEDNETMNYYFYDIVVEKYGMSFREQDILSTTSDPLEALKELKERFKPTKSRVDRKKSSTTKLNIKAFYNVE